MKAFVKSSNKDPSNVKFSRHVKLLPVAENIFERMYGGQESGDVDVARRDIQPKGVFLT